ncbi:MAG: GDYXXLXY domain-containing protein [Magnetococcus sp. DMHC-6]
MNRQRFYTFVALLIPILALSGLAGWKHWHQSHGQEVVLSVQALDPRDLLSGHYLTFQVDYGLESMCRPISSNDALRNDALYVCLDPKNIFETMPQGEACSLFIRGSCRRGVFEAGIERFFIPQEYASRLERAISNKICTVLVSVTDDGTATLQDFRIEGRSWSDYVHENFAP